MMEKLSGTLTALVTPFKKNGEVDIKALKNLVQLQLKNGIDGLVPCGTTGEAAMLSHEEYKLVLQTIVKEVQKKVPVIAGATSESTAMAVEHSKIAKEAGVDGLLHATPYYRPNLKGLIAHYSAIAQATDLPIVLYNIPGRTGLNFTAADSLEIVKKVDHVVAIKEASGNITQIKELIKDSPSYFSVLSGDDALTFSIMKLGGHGVICTTSNEVPREMTDLTTAALAGNFEKAKKIHEDWADLMRVNFIEPNPQPVKTALSLMGKIEEVFRLPMVPMEKGNKEILTTVLRKHKLI